VVESAHRKRTEATIPGTDERQETPHSRDKSDDSVTEYDGCTLVVYNASGLSHDCPMVPVALLVALPAGGGALAPVLLIVRFTFGNTFAPVLDDRGTVALLVALPAGGGTLGPVLLIVRFTFGSTFTPVLDERGTVIVALLVVFVVVAPDVAFLHVPANGLNPFN
jgi:hypothetical protein